MVHEAKNIYYVALYRKSFPTPGSEQGKIRSKTKIFTDFLGTLTPRALQWSRDE